MGIIKKIRAKLGDAFCSRRIVKAEYTEAKDLIEVFNKYSVQMLAEARAAGMGTMQAQVNPMVVNAYAVVERYENRNWFLKRWGKKTPIVDLGDDVVWDLAVPA